MSTIRPTKPQFDYITATDLYPALVAGFGAGKTEAAVKRSIIGKLRYPTLNRGFYEPTYDLIRMIAFPRFEEALTELGIPYRLYKSPLNYISIEGMGNIFFRSMDNPGRIIGYEHADADVDELDTLKIDDAAEVWRRVLSRNREKKPDGMPNTVGVTTTPEGFKFVYKAWKQDPKQGYRIIQAPTRSNPHLPEGYIQSLQDIYTPELLEAYLNGEFVNLTSGTVYRNYDRERCNSSETVQGKEALRIGMDFNVEHMAATVYVMRDKVWHAVDEFVDYLDTPDICRAIKDRYPENKITVYPDASGKNRKTTGAAESDIKIIKNNGFAVKAHDSNPMVKDRINATNKAFSDGLLKVNFRKCPTVARCFEQQAYDKNGEPDKKSGQDHQNDASTYPIAYELPIIRPHGKAAPVRFF